jgi:NitT/TauT family transport system substrate-binding protein
MFLARERGWLNDSQVQLVQTRSASESISALRSGKVQAAALTLDEVLVARASGLALSVVLVFNVSLGADMLVARSQLPTMTR